MNKLFVMEKHGTIILAIRMVGTTLWKFYEKSFWRSDTDIWRPPDNIYGLEHALCPVELGLKIIGERYGYEPVPVSRLTALIRYGIAVE